MEDSRFDDIIKGKVGEYEAPNFDPAALASMHHRMASLQTWPWYTRYRTELIIGGGLVLATLILLFVQWRWNNQTEDILRQELAALKNQNEQLAHMRTEIAALKQNRPDTIRIYQTREIPSPLYASLNDRIDRLEYTRPRVHYEEFVYLGKSDDLPSEFLSELEQAGFIKKDGEDVYLSSSSFQVLTIHHKDLQDKGVDYAYPKYEFLVPSQEEDISDLKENKSKSISAKTIRNLNKHYRGGVGLRLAPQIDYSAGFYEIGSGSSAFGIGGLAELVLSPSLSLETGVKYNFRKREVKSDFEALNLTDVNPQDLLQVHEIKISSHVIDIPFNLKYRYPVSMKSTLSGSVGYSFFFYPGEKVVFESESNSGAANLPADQQFGYSQYPGSLNFLIGLNREIKNRQSIEGSLYYQRSMGQKGFEQANVNYLGARVAYWFLIR